MQLAQARATLEEARKYGFSKGRAPIAIAVLPVNRETIGKPDFHYTPSIILQPVPDPVLVAGLTTSGVNWQGYMTAMAGLGDDNPNIAAAQFIRDHIAAGTLYPEPVTHTTRGPRDLWGHLPTHTVISGMAATMGGTPAGHLFPNGRPRSYWNADEAERARIDAQFASYGSDHPGIYVSVDQRPASAFGLVTFSVGHGRLTIKFCTHQLVVSDPDTGVELDLNLRPAGKSRKDAKPVRPVDAAGIIADLSMRGFTIVDPYNLVTDIRKTAGQKVIAYPQAGKPAYATVSIPSALSWTLPEDTKTVLGLPESVSANAVNVHGAASATELSDLLELLPGVDHAIHPGVTDVVNMARAVPFEGDDRLHEHQTPAVGLHLATSLGYVNASDPGGGKTIMSLVAMAQRATTIDNYRGLVVTEAQLRRQWEVEISEWFPQAHVIRVDGKHDAEAVAEQVHNHEGPLVLVAAYPLTRGAYTEQVARDTAALTHDDADGEDTLVLFGDAVDDTDTVDEEVGVGDVLGALLLDTHWHDFIVDEAETLRGVSSKAAKGCWAIRNNSDIAVVLTGTPINRGVDDLGRLIMFARNDNTLFDGGRGGKKLSVAFDLGNDDDLQRFTDAIGPVLYRRTKSEFTGDIPTIHPTVVMLDPRPEELALDAGARGELKRVFDELVTLTEAAKAADPDDEEYAELVDALKSARGAWLGGTTLARQAASDPAALIGSESGAAQLLAAQGLIEAANAQPGTKRVRAIADITERILNGEKVLVFTEFSTVARGLITDLDAAGIRVGEVLGSGGAKRDRMVAEFQSGALDVLVCTSSAEKGLNLQAATTIVHYDLPWTPKGVIQRTGRAQRLASEHTELNVVFYIMKGTIEERVCALVVSRAVESMRALDTARGLSVEETDMGAAFSGIAMAAADTREGRSQSILMDITRQLVDAQADKQAS